MPRQVALLMCSIFVLWLLRYDRRQVNRSSLVLWVPTLWMLTVVSRSLDTWFGMEGGDREAGGVLGPGFQIMLICLGGITLHKRSVNWSNLVRNNLWLIVLLAYMVLSVTWSDMPMRSFRSWVKELVAVLMALIVCTERFPKEALQSVLRRCVYILIPFSGTAS